jgi:hypothetical protein
MNKRNMLSVILAGSLILPVVSPGDVEALSVGISDAESNRTFVPIRYLSEQFGYEVSWEPVEQRVQVLRDDDILSLTIGKKDADWNGIAVTNDAAHMWSMV